MRTAAFDNILANNNSFARHIAAKTDRQKARNKDKAEEKYAKFANCSDSRIMSYFARQRLRPDTPG